MLPSCEEFDALTRVDFNVFVERVFVELNGSTTYSDNFGTVRRMWHGMLSYGSQRG